ncbi:hypothetical protein DFH11DRAFT_1748335 [Phellopilus nigrolimitatus]|nr:hypothetical protein DFH11DRAFT_1748335 [Phellopilus nigrolimitatus]
MSAQVKLLGRKNSASMDANMGHHSAVSAVGALRCKHTRTRGVFRQQTNSDRHRRRTRHLYGGISDTDIHVWGQQTGSLVLSGSHTHFNNRGSFLSEISGKEEVKRNRAALQHDIGNADDVRIKFRMPLCTNVSALSRTRDAFFAFAYALGARWISKFGEFMAQCRHSCIFLESQNIDDDRGCADIGVGIQRMQSFRRARNMLEDWAADKFAVPNVEQTNNNKLSCQVFAAPLEVIHSTYRDRALSVYCGHRASRRFWNHLQAIITSAIGSTRAASLPYFPNIITFLQLIGEDSESKLRRITIAEADGAVTLRSHFPDMMMQTFAGAESANGRLREISFLFFALLGGRVHDSITVESCDLSGNVHIVHARSLDAENKLEVNSAIAVERRLRPTRSQAQAATFPPFVGQSAPELFGLLAQYSENIRKSAPETKYNALDNAAGAVARMIPGVLIRYIDQLLPVFSHVFDPNWPDRLGDETRAGLLNLVGALNAENSLKTSPESLLRKPLTRVFSTNSDVAAGRFECMLVRLAVFKTSIVDAPGALDEAERSGLGFEGTASLPRQLVTE